jgi:hypothetical protein
VLTEGRALRCQNADEDRREQLSRHMYVPPLTVSKQLDCQQQHLKTSRKSSHDRARDVIEVMQSVPIS